MRAKSVPEGAKGLRVLPNRAKIVSMKSETTENGEICGPMIIDGRVLQGRWFTYTEAKIIARSLGAKFEGDPAIEHLRQLQADGAVPPLPEEKK